MRILLVDGFKDAATPTQIILDELNHLNLSVSTLNLSDEGFGYYMSKAERDNYHNNDGENLINPSQIKSAELIKATDGLILYYPLENGLFPPIVKSWFERVFIPGVSFTFTKGGRVKGALKNLRCIHFLVLAKPDTIITKRSDPNKSLLRAIRMNAGLRCQTSLSVVNDLNALGIAARNNLERAKSC